MHQFYDPEADAALVAALEANLDSRVELLKIDAHVNDATFAEAAATKMQGVDGEMTQLTDGLHRTADQAPQHELKKAWGSLTWLASDELTQSRDITLGRVVIKRACLTPNTHIPTVLRCCTCYAASCGT